MRNRTSRTVVAFAAGAALLLAAACGGGGEDNESGGSSDALVFGTSESFTGADPAGDYSLPWSLILANTGQNLLWIPPGGSQPEPQLAKQCDWEDEVTYTCTLKPDLKFSDGSDLTSEDVKFSMDRQVEMQEPTGPWTLFKQVDEKSGDVTEGVESTEAPDPQTVTFNLAKPDATWPHRLTHAGASIVPKGEYSATEVRSKDFIGAGPYVVTKWQPSSQIVLEKNEHYTGDIEMKNDQVVIQKYKSEASLKNAVENGSVQVAYRTLTPTMVADMEKNGADKGVEIVKGDGVGISYLVFNQNKGAFKDEAVRQAAAYLIDREHIASDVYDDTVKPLYTMVPDIYEGSVPAFEERYGSEPNPAEAKKVLKDAGIETPVKTTLYYNTDHYGETSADMYVALEDQLEAGGVFDIKLDTDAYDLYSEQYPTGAYEGFQLGWYPDFPDPDNYVQPFFASGNFLGEGQGYSNPEMDRMLGQERKIADDEEKRSDVFAEIQKLAAEEVPTLPIWQDEMIAAVREGVTGVEDTFDTAYTFRFWLVDVSEAQ